MRKKDIDLVFGVLFCVATIAAYLAVRTFVLVSLELFVHNHKLLMAASQLTNN